jgi:hypothetical protein
MAGPEEDFKLIIMTIEQFNINKVKKIRSRSIKTNYNTDLNSKLFLDPDLMPLFPKEEKLIQFSQDSYILEEISDQYKKFTDLITRKIFQNKVNFKFYNFTKKPDFANKNIYVNYINILNSYYRLFSSYINRRQLKINNINDFYKYFLIYIRTYSNILPFTLIGTTTGKRLYYENTGLSIVLDQKNGNNIPNYFRAFITKPREANAYIKIANLHGFEVDLANPYRLVYNPYRGGTEGDVEGFYLRNFENYSSLELRYIDSLVDTMYRQYVVDKFSNHESEKNKVYIPNKNCKNQIKTIKENINKTGVLTVNQKLKLYLYALAAENNMPIDEKIDKVYIQSTQIARSLDTRAAMVYIVSQVRRDRRTTTLTRTT